MTANRQVGAHHGVYQRCTLKTLTAFRIRAIKPLSL
jgi:hypothetical protein